MSQTRRKLKIFAPAILLPLISGCRSTPRFRPVPEASLKTCEFDPLYWQRGDRSFGICELGGRDDRAWVLISGDLPNRKGLELAPFEPRTFVDGDTVRVYNQRREMRPGWYNVSIDRRSWWKQATSDTSQTGWHLLTTSPLPNVSTSNLQSGIYRQDGNELKRIAAPYATADPLEVIRESGTYFIASPGYGLIYEANLKDLTP